MKKFFILSIGRSGTKFLANLLNKSDDVIVLHEPYNPDKRIYKEKYIDDNINHYDYLTCRFLEISTENKFLLDHKVYGEVNSFLRRHCKLLKNFTNSKVIHLVRDGRDVVRSLISREAMTNYDKNTNFIVPKEGDPYKKIWYKMTRFERCCWYWKTENEYISNYIKDFVRFEDIIKDYTYFKELLDKIGISLPINVWKKEICNPKNKTNKYLLPSCENWEEWQEKSFIKICGDEMKKYGYF